MVLMDYCSDDETIEFGAAPARLRVNLDVGAGRRYSIKDASHPFTLTTSVSLRFPRTDDEWFSTIDEDGVAHFVITADQVAERINGEAAGLWQAEADGIAERIAKGSVILHD